MKKERRVLGRGLAALVSSSNPNAFYEDRSVASNQDSLALNEEKISVDRVAKDSKGPGQVASVQSYDRNNGAIKSPSRTETSDSRVPTVLPLSEIDNTPEQPRKHFSEEEIIELSESIKVHGILQPVLVRPKNGRYEIVAGERRCRAAKLAGLTEVPVIVKDLDEQETLKISLVENIQRQDLDAIEEAIGYQRLIQEFRLTQDQVAAATGKNRASIANALRLLKLPEAVRTMIVQRNLSFGHAKVILSVREPAVQLNLARKAVEEGLSVRQLEAIVSRVVVLDANKRAKKVGPTANGNNMDVPSFVRETIDNLRNLFGTKIKMRHSEKGSGTIEIEYFSEQELDRILDLMSPKTPGS